MTARPRDSDYGYPRLLGTAELAPADAQALLDGAESYLAMLRQPAAYSRQLAGRTVMNLFFESSTRTRTSFEMAAKRLGCDVINMAIAQSSIKKGETLLDTAATLDAMHPDVLVVRHGDSGAVHLLAPKVRCAVINAGDGAHEHPTQALLDALAIRRQKGRIQGLTVTICGDVRNSRVARSNIHLLTKLGAHVRVVGPPTLMPGGIETLGAESFQDMAAALTGADIVMMLRLQTERMQGQQVPSIREYFRYFGLDRTKLGYAKDDALVLHPGPMNRGVEIDSEVADDISRSLVLDQVELGVAVRMACLDHLVQALAPHESSAAAATAGRA